MVRQFEEYGVYKEIIEKMVTKDNIKYTRTFYNDLQKYNKKVKIYYEPNFWKAYSLSEDISEPTIFASRILLFDQDTQKKAGYHAVSLICDKNKRYIFDPNGIVTSEHRYLYLCHDNIPRDGRQFSKKYLIDVPHKIGIQAIDTGIVIPPGHINNSGYCMIYMYLGLKSILQSREKNNKSIVSLAKYLTDTTYKKLSSLFPYDIHLKTLDIIENIFYDFI